MVSHLVFSLLVIMLKIIGYLANLTTFETNLNQLGL